MAYGLDGPFFFLRLAELVSSPCLFLHHIVLFSFHPLLKIIVHRHDRHHHHHHQHHHHHHHYYHCHCHCQYTIIAGSRASGFIWFDFHSFLFACVCRLVDRDAVSVFFFFLFFHCLCYIFHPHRSWVWAVGVGRKRCKCRRWNLHIHVISTIRSLFPVDK